MLVLIRSTEITRHFVIASLIFSTLTSLKPLIFNSVFRVAPWTDCGCQVNDTKQLNQTYSHSVEPIGFELGDVGCTDAMGLDGVNVDDEVLFRCRLATREGQLNQNELYIDSKVVTRI